MFVAGWIDGFGVLAGWWDGFRVLAAASWVQAVVLLVLFAVMLAPVVYRRAAKRRTDEDAVYGHRVLWDE